MNIPTYADRTEAVKREIIEVIMTGDVQDAEAEYDVWAIADEMLVWHEAYDAETNTYYLDEQGYRLREEYSAADENGAWNFWSLVEQNAR